MLRLSTNIHNLLVVVPQTGPIVEKNFLKQLYYFLNDFFVN
jgi:hypothetical protein